MPFMVKRILLKYVQMTDRPLFLRPFDTTGRTCVRHGRTDIDVCEIADRTREVAIFEPQTKVSQRHEDELTRSKVERLNGNSDH